MRRSPLRSFCATLRTGPLSRLMAAFTLFDGLGGFTSEEWASGEVPQKEGG